MQVKIWATMMFDNLANMDSDQNFMAEVFYDIAEQSPETLIAMAEMDQGLYENMASDPYGGDMSASDLMQNIMSDVGYDDPYMDPMMMGDPYMDSYDGNVRSLHGFYDGNG